MEINLNLIPPHRKEEITHASRVRMVLLWEVEIFMALVLCIGMLFSIRYIVRLNLAIAQNEMKNGGNLQYKKIKEYDDFVAAINSKTSEIEKIQRGQLYWSKLFQILGEKVPSEIELHSLSVKNYRISLTGRAATRAELVFFKENLEKTMCAEEVNFPFSNLISKENLDFEISFKVKKECVQ